MRWKHKGCEEKQAKRVKKYKHILGFEHQAKEFSFSVLSVASLCFFVCGLALR